MPEPLEAATAEGFFITSFIKLFINDEYINAVYVILGLSESPNPGRSTAYTVYFFESSSMLYINSKLLAPTARLCIRRRGRPLPVFL